MKNFEKNFGMGYTGRLLEEESFGRPLLSEDEKKRYMKYKEAMNLVKDKQAFEPGDPDPRFANDLHASIAEKLKLDDYGKLKFFSSVDSPLDYYHGVDAFFEVEGKDGKKRIVTIDISGNSKKDKGKADVLINMPMDGLDPKEDRDDYIKKIKEATSEIADRLREY